MSIQPNIIKLGKNTYRLDLRSKAFDPVRSTLANGRKTLEFDKRVDAEMSAGTSKPATCGQFKTSQFEVGFFISFGAT